MILVGDCFKTPHFLLSPYTASNRPSLIVLSPSTPLLPNKRLQCVGHCWRRQLGKGTSSSHLPLWVLAGSLRKSTFPHMVQRSSMHSRKVEQGWDRVAERRNNLPSFTSQTVQQYNRIIATRPYTKSIVSSLVVMLYIPTPDDTQLAEHTTQLEIWQA